MNKEESLAMLDRFIVSNNDALNEGNTLVVQVLDGYIYIDRKKEENKEMKTSVFFSEFDGVLNIPFKELIHEDIRR